MTKSTPTGLKLRYVVHTWYENNVLKRGWLVYSTRYHALKNLRLGIPFTYRFRDNKTNDFVVIETIIHLESSCCKVLTYIQMQKMGYLPK